MLEREVLRSVAQHDTTHPYFLCVTGLYLPLMRIQQFRSQDLAARKVLVGRAQG